MDKTTTLDQALSALIQKALAGIDTATAFLTAEMPDIVRQLVMWNIAKGALWIVVGVALIAVAITIAVMIKLGYKNKDSIFCDNDYPPSIAAVLCGIASVAMLCLGSVMLLHNTLILLQLWIAPKIWLIEYAAALVRHQ